MLQIIFGIFILFIGIALAKYIFKFLLNTALFLVGLCALVLGGPAFLFGYLTERFSFFLGIRWVVSLLLVLSGLAISFAWSIEGCNAFEAYTFGSIKFLLASLLAGVMLPGPRKINNLINNGLEKNDLEPKVKEYYLCIYTSFALLFLSAATPFATWYYGISESLVWWTGLTYWIVAILVQIYAMSELDEIKKIVTEINDETNENNAINSTEWLGEIKSEYKSNSKIATLIFTKIISQKILNGEFREQEMAGDNWLLNEEWYEEKMNDFNEKVKSNMLNTKDDLKKLFDNRLNLTEPANDDLINRYLEDGDYYSFEDGLKFVSFEYSDDICTCISCGISKVKNSDNDENEWYCSTTCQDTEKLCQEIHERPYDDFISSAATNSLVLITLPDTWSENAKMFASGAQGHGFAAEKANHIIDKTLLKTAKIVGDDNAKNGADRLVNGSEIQTKYCSTAARSVGAGFDGQNGSYRYYDSNGAPMQIEVPKDQYTKAIETMENKIKQGKVPGVSDPSEATNLVRQGHITYAQAQNITKFGTFESITYDLAEGSIVSLAAGGISFGLTASIFYCKTGDQKTALRTAAIQAGKTFSRTMAVYVTAQQLHRLGTVQVLLKNVDFSIASPTVRDALQNGMGVKNLNSLNKVMRGTLVTSFALVAITTGPDMIKMVRGHISGAQFIKNLAITTSSVAGSVVGSIAGGVILSPLGPFGALAGRAAGGMIGGFAAAQLSKMITGSLIEDDKVKTLEIVQDQVTWLATTFLLNEYEIENLNDNLARVLDQKMLEVIYASKKNARATVNFMIKPLVVSIVKQRPAFKYGENELIEMVDDLEDLATPMPSAA